MFTDDPFKREAKRKWKSFASNFGGHDKLQLYNYVIFALLQQRPKGENFLKVFQLIIVRVLWERKIQKSRRKFHCEVDKFWKVFRSFWNLNSAEIFWKREKWTTGGVNIVNAYIRAQNSGQGRQRIFMKIFASEHEIISMISQINLIAMHRKTIDKLEHNII